MLSPTPQPVEQWQTLWQTGGGLNAQEITRFGLSMTDPKYRGLPREVRARLSDDAGFHSLEWTKKGWEVLKRDLTRRLGSWQDALVVLPGLRGKTRILEGAALIPAKDGTWFPVVVAGVDGVGYPTKEQSQEIVRQIKGAKSSDAKAAQVLDSALHPDGGQIGGGSQEPVGRVRQAYTKVRSKVVEHGPKLGWGLALTFILDRIFRRS